MKLLHTADWHLGHTLHGLARDDEHGRFLDWLVGQLAERGADALVVAGDVFDSANPPASAQALFFRFLREAKRRCPGLDVVVVAGNHDSGSRLAAPAPVLEALGVTVVGGLPRQAGLGGGAVDWQGLCVPLHDSAGGLAAWCGAMPFVRNADLPPVDDTNTDALVQGVAARYAELTAALRKANPSGLPMILTGHCYMRGGNLSELSERKIQRGNQQALPVDLFPGDVAYVALGHLHLAQAVGGRPEIRYSGSPIPLAIDEARYRHQVLEVELDAGAPARVTALPVPRFVDILRLPEEGPLELARVLGALDSLVPDDSLSREAWPYLEVRVRLERPEPGLREQIERLLAGKPVRLVKITSVYPGTGGPLAEAVPEARLDSLDPQEVFRRRYARSFDGAPPAELLAAFHELLDAVQEPD